MATLTLRLIWNAQTRKRDIVIAYDSDSDALPMEHEADHKRIVDQLIGGGSLQAAEVGVVIVERDGQSRQSSVVEQNEQQGKDPLDQSS